MLRICKSRMHLQSKHPAQLFSYELESNFFEGASSQQPLIDWFFPEAVGWKSSHLSCQDLSIVKEAEMMAWVKDTRRSEKAFSNFGSRSKAETFSRPPLRNERKRSKVMKQIFHSQLFLGILAWWMLDEKKVKALSTSFAWRFVMVRVGGQTIKIKASKSSKALPRLGSILIAMDFCWFSLPLALISIYHSKHKPTPPTFSERHNLCRSRQLLFSCAATRTCFSFC